MMIDMGDEEDFFQELVEDAIQNLERAVNLKKQIAHDQHDVHGKIMGMETLIGDLDGKTPEEYKHLHKLSHKIASLLLEIQEIIQSFEHAELSIVAEEERHLEQLHESVAHRNFRLVKVNIEHVKEEIDPGLRLEKREVKQLHSKLKKLRKITEPSNIRAVIKKDVGDEQKREELDRLWESYLTSIYRFARIYENVFNDLFEKDKHLGDNLERDAKKIEKA